MTLRQAAQMALEALQYPLETSSQAFDADKAELLSHRAIDALRAVLAEPEQPHDLLCVCGAEWDIYSDGREELVTAPTPRKPLIPVVHGLALSPSEEKWYAAGWKAAEAAHGIGEQT